MFTWNFPDSQVNGYPRCWSMVLMVFTLLAVQFDTARTNGQGILGAGTPKGKGEVGAKKFHTASASLREARDAVVSDSSGSKDCHGGNANVFTKEGSHVAPKYPALWPSAANPVRSYALMNYESPEFVRFMNPGDLRVAHIACGQCHANEVLQLRKSMMTHGCMLWGAAIYNNGGSPTKWSRYGESYSMHGQPQRIQNVPAPTQYEIDFKGILPYLDPLPRFEASQPANFLRIFERGGRFRAEIGIPERTEEPGRPRERLSNRGPGTENRTDPA